MDETTLRILDILSREIGNPLSINELTQRIEKIYGTAHYVNIYDKINSLATENIIKLSKTGRSSIATLNFENYLLIDLLSEIELRRKQNFLKNRQEMQMFFMEINTYLHDLQFIRSISMINSEKNAKLNRAELIIHMKKSDDRKTIQETKIAIHSIMENLQKMHNIKIDYLLLESEMFFDLLKSNETNPLREMLYNKLIILYPQDFWIEIKSAIESGMKIILKKDETNPAKIKEQDLVYNLARFGYVEFGPQLKQGESICIEYIITAIMFQNDARRIDAIPIIIAKNSEKTSYDLLLFLSRKYNFEGKILGILRALRNLVAHGMKSIDEPIRLLETMKIEEIKADQRSIKEKMKLYNVIK